MAANEGSYPFSVSDPVTALQQFRVLTNDTDPTATDEPSVGIYKFSSDIEASVLLSIYPTDARLAAARQLESIAVSEALMRKWSDDDMSMDGAAVANALRQLAKQMRDEVIAGIALEDDFEIVPTGTDDHLFDWPVELGYPEWIRPLDWRNL